MGNAVRRRLWVSALTATLTVAAPGAMAAERHRAIPAQAGTPIRLGNYTHFNGATCKATVLPKISVRTKPSKGILTIVEDVAPLRSAGTERGKLCIGKAMPTAVIYYNPSMNASGEDTIAYDVQYPGCARCETRQYSFTATIERLSESPSTTTAPSTTEDGGE